MKPLFYLVSLAFVLAWNGIAASTSYVVLRDSAENSLVRVSADGKSITTIANGAGGVGLAIDPDGNYAVAAKSALLRVTLAGVVTTIARAPEDSLWVSVAVDRAGNLFVGDSKQPVVWRISPLGNVVAKLGRPGIRDVAVNQMAPLAVDPSGDCVLLIQEFRLDGPTLYRMSHDGSVIVTAVKGSGPKLTSALAPDGDGNYLFVAKEGVSGGPVNMSLFRLMAGGKATKLADLPFGFGMIGLVRNSATGEIIISQQEAGGRLLSILANGSSVTTIVERGGVSHATAVLVDRDR